MYFDGGQKSYKLSFEPLLVKGANNSSSEIKCSKLGGFRDPDNINVMWPILMCFIKNVFNFCHGSWPLKVKVKMFLFERVILFEIPFTQKNLFFNVWGQKSDIASLSIYKRIFITLFYSSLKNYSTSVSNIWREAFHYHDF